MDSSNAMVTTSGTGTTTTGSITFGTWWPYPMDTALPYSSPYTQCVYTRYPSWGSTDYHVFACEHATACKCGKASRKVEPPKCGVCGK